jgi:hypothetical protein
MARPPGRGTGPKHVGNSLRKRNGFPFRRFGLDFRSPNFQEGQIKLSALR